MAKQLHRNLSYFSFFLLVCLLSGCEEATEWDFRPQENGALVVEAILTDERKVQEVLLSLSYDDLNGSPPAVTDAAVRVEGGGETFFFRPDPLMPGRYRSERVFSARLQVVYTLEIDWNGTTYRAEDVMTEVLPMPVITFQSAGIDSLTIAEATPLYLPGEQSMYEIDIDWSNGTNDPAAQAKMFFYTFNTIDVSELFRPARETVVFPRGSIVNRKKYSLNPSFAAYLRSLLLETEWQGGIFDEASASLPTNVDNGGLGFFAVCAVLRDTVVAE